MEASSKRYSTPSRWSSSLSMLTSQVLQPNQLLASIDSACSARVRSPAKATANSSRVISPSLSESIMLKSLSETCDKAPCLTPVFWARPQASRADEGSLLRCSLAAAIMFSMRSLLICSRRACCSSKRSRTPRTLSARSLSISFRRDLARCTRSSCSDLVLLDCASCRLSCSRSCMTRSRCCSCCLRSASLWSRLIRSRFNLCCQEALPLPCEACNVE
mmetsp:Transcript_8585/g.19017  ORF Transcript_8585/g.19017 Transcript_8585/m.19017 type:complete len:218 (+) Transcript_8585:965-1618(+)